MQRKNRSLTLVEVGISVAVLSVVLLGLGAAFARAQFAQTAARESKAATIAATSKMDEIVAWVDLNPGSFSTIITQYHQTGFHVNQDPSQIGVEDSDNKITLRPASDASALFPTDRNSLPAAIKAMAGYVEVADVTGRTGLVEVTITVAWQTKVGPGGDSGNKLMFYRMIQEP